MGDKLLKCSLFGALFILLVVIIFCFIFNFKYNRQVKINNQLTTELDYYKNLTKPFIDKKDSIEYNIIKRDSVIYNIIKEYEYEKAELDNMDNSAIVDAFEKLVWAD